jgi:hypothetical protein
VSWGEGGKGPSGPSPTTGARGMAMEPAQLLAAGPAGASGPSSTGYRRGRGCMFMFWGCGCVFLL